MTRDPNKCPRGDGSHFHVLAREHRLLWTAFDPRAGEVMLYDLNPDHPLFVENLQVLSPTQRAVLRVYLDATSDVLARIRAETQPPIAP